MLTRGVVFAPAGNPLRARLVFDQDDTLVKHMRIPELEQHLELPEHLADKEKAEQLWEACNACHKQWEADPTEQNLRPWSAALHAAEQQQLLVAKPRLALRLCQELSRCVAEGADDTGIGPWPNSRLQQVARRMNTTAAEIMPRTAKEAGYTFSGR